jgi:Tol biopolymer transport system component
MQHACSPRVLMPMHKRSVLLLAALLAACSSNPIASPSSSSSEPGASSSAPATAPSAAPASASASDGGGLQGQLAYVAGMDDPQIYLLDLATGESRQLTNLRPEDAELTGEGPLRPAISCGFGPSMPAWSPNGTQMAFAYGSCDSVVFVISVEGDIRRIGDGRSPAWSPDGGWLLYADNVPYMPCGAGCQESGAGMHELRIVDVAGGGDPSPFTADGSTSLAGSPQYSPDGTLIAYSGPPQGGDPDVFGATYLIAADGSGARLVANGGYPSAWLADGRLLITRERDGSVHAVDIESGESDQLGGEQTASVSPDGTRVLAWTSDPVTGNSGLRLLTSDGDPLVELPGSFGAWRPDSTTFAVFAPDGSLQLVSRGGDLIASFEIGDGGFWAAWRPES